MVSPTSLLTKNSNKDTSEWASHNLFAHFTELASVPNHPALAHVPPVTSFPQTQWFLQANRTKKIWERGDMMGGIQQLALRLDQEWPEWAANSTNVLGILLSDLLADFYPWLETLPVNQTSISTMLRFERHLFDEAQLRHTWDWWKDNRRSNPAACFRPSLLGGKVGVKMPGNVINAKTRRTYTWRGFYEIEMKRGGKKGEKVTEDDWVVVD